jgi:hypothetical protein
MGDLSGQSNQVGFNSQVQALLHMRIIGCCAHDVKSGGSSLRKEKTAGQNIHFMHIRSLEPDALPLILTHG